MVYEKPRNQGDQQQHIKIGLSNTLIGSLNFKTDQLNRWMLQAKLNPEKCAN